MWILLLSRLFQECFASLFWKIVPRLLDGGIAEVPAQSYYGVTFSLCALKCQMRPKCQLFRYDTSECNLYDGGRFKRISEIQGNRFYQKMADHCVTGRDEWFPEYQICVWIPTQTYSYEEAKSLCESAGKVMLGTKHFSRVLDLMDLVNTKYIHVYCQHIAPNLYKTDDGIPIPSTLWCPNQPDSDSGCLGLQNDQDSWCTYAGLDDIICSDKRKFFCVDKTS